MLAPSIEVLTLSRLAQGFGGAAGVVLARAVITDRAHGVGAAKLFSFMMIVAGVAQEVAPLLGGSLVGLIGWRGVFWVLTGLGMVMLVGIITSWPSRCRRNTDAPPGSPRSHTTPGTCSATGCSSNILTFVFSFGTLFAYISASPFVLQGILGEYRWCSRLRSRSTPSASSHEFPRRRLLDRFDPRALLRTGVGMLVVGSALLVVDAIVGPHLWPTPILFWSTVSGLGLMFANATTLALAEVRAAAGTGSASWVHLSSRLGAVVPRWWVLAVRERRCPWRSPCGPARTSLGRGRSPSATGLTCRRGVTTTAIRVLHERLGVREATQLQVAAGHP